MGGAAAHRVISPCPNGAKVNSQGWQPLERRPQRNLIQLQLSPKGATDL